MKTKWLVEAIGIIIIFLLLAAGFSMAKMIMEGVTIV